VRLNDDLPAGGRFPLLPAWAPDSARLAYVAEQHSAGAAELYTIRADGTQRVADRRSDRPAGGRCAGRPTDRECSINGFVSSPATIELYAALPDGTGRARLNAPGGSYLRSHRPRVVAGQRDGALRRDHSVE
jgi:hypothetical protein